MMSKTSRLATALMSGEQLTARQIAARYSVSNPYDMVYNLRNEGANIELRARTNSKGVTNLFYTFVQPKTKRKAA
jgi:hypothetical protein